MSNTQDLNKIDLDLIDSKDFVNMEDSKFYKSFTKAISIRLPLVTLLKLKTIAEQKQIPYQKLIKLYIKKGLNNEKHT